MEKILIAIKDEFVVKVYEDFFKNEGFQILQAYNLEELQEIALKDKPDVLFIDFQFAQENDFMILKLLKSNEVTRLTPIIIFSKTEQNGDREKMMDLEVKDFVVGAYDSPVNVLGRINTHLGKTKSYKIEVDNSSETIKNLSADLGYNNEATCQKCLAPLEMIMLRDLTKGKNYFKVSLVCPKCKI